jgi:hypothetical protein
VTGGGRLVVLSGPLRPHEMMFQALAVLLGAVYLAGSPAPTSVAALMPEWAVRLWAGGLLLSGLLTGLSLVLRRRPETSLRVQQSAMLIGAAALVWTTYAIFVYAWSSRALLGGGFCLCWAAADVIRAEQCRRDARKVAP